MKLLMLMIFLYSTQFIETLPKEMKRRRLALFILTPNVLMFNPRRPKAVRNTIGDLLKALSHKALK